jgi:hypothetical protein
MPTFAGIGAVGAMIGTAAGAMIGAAIAVPVAAVAAPAMITYGLMGLGGAAIGLVAGAVADRATAPTVEPVDPLDARRQELLERAELLHERLKDRADVFRQVKVKNLSPEDREAALFPFRKCALRAR